MLASLPQPSAAFPQQCASPLQPSTVHVLPPHPLSFILQQCAPPLQILVINTPSTPLVISLQGRGGIPPPPSVVCSYATLLSSFLPQKFDTPLQP